MTNTLNKSRQEYLSMFEGCAQFMAAQAYNAKNIEIGGGLYGLWSHAGRAVILLATPAGPGACYERAHFAVDPEYVTAINEQLQSRFGIQYLGNWHSHHRLGLDHPSSGDVAQIHSVASRNNIPRMIQIVVTYADGAGYDQRMEPPINSVAKVGKNMHETMSKLTSHFGRFEKERADQLSMRINSFVYPEALKGSCVRCCVKILPGQSPVRQVQEISEILQQPDLSSVAEFPLDKMIYDRLEPAGELDNIEQTLPTDLLEQFSLLPKSVAGGMEVQTEKGLIVLSLPLSDQQRVCVAYKAKGIGSQMLSIHLVLEDNKMSANISQDVLAHNPDPSLSFIHRYFENNKKFDAAKI